MMCWTKCESGNASMLRKTFGEARLQVKGIYAIQFEEGYSVAQSTTIVYCLSRQEGTCLIVKHPCEDGYIGRNLLRAATIARVLGRSNLTYDFLRGAQLRLEKFANFERERCCRFALLP